MQHIKLFFLEEMSGPEKGHFGGRITTETLFKEQGHLLGRPPHAGHRIPHCSTLIVLLPGM